MVEDAGIVPHMARATADVQSAIATLRANRVFDDVAGEDWRDLVDAVHATTRETTRR